MGAITGWTPLAVAYETVPVDRLRLLYRYRRSRDEAIVKFRKRIETRKSATLLRLPGSLLARMFSSCMCVVAIPFTQAAWYVGSIAGIVRACAGRKSAQYARVTGS